MLSNFPNLDAMARHCVLSVDGDIGFLDRKGRTVVDDIATDAFHAYSQQLLQEYKLHPAEGGMHLGVILENDGDRPWKSLTIRLSDSLLRRLYPIRHQQSTDPLTTFQKRNQWQSIYRGLELLLEYRVESMPETPMFCPVILDRKIDAATRQVLLGGAAEDVDETTPLLEIINLISLMTPTDKNKHIVRELIQKICAGVIYKSLRKPSELKLMDEEKTSDWRREPIPEVKQPGADSTSVMIRVALGHQYEQMSIGRLREYETFSRLADVPLALLAGRMSIISLHRGEKLFARGSSDPYAFFLMDGSVELEAADQRVKTIKAGDAAAKRPLSLLRPRQFTARAIEDTKFLRVDYDQVNALSGDADKFVGAESPAASMFEVLYEDLNQRRWVLAALPALTRRVLGAMEKNLSDPNRVAELVAVDPAATVKVLAAANRPTTPGEYAVPVSTLVQAVNRLQPHIVLSLVREIIDQDDFEIRDTTVQKRLEQLWRHSLEVACISYVLSRHTSSIDPERAWLHGLIHDIGAFGILKYVDFTAGQDAVEQMVTSLHGWIGGVILKEWGLPEEFIITNLEADDWYRNVHGPVDYCDVVVLAQLHHFVGTPISKVVPTIDMVPLSAKVPAGNLTPSVSVEIIKQSRQMAKDVMRLLS